MFLIGAAKMIFLVSLQFRLVMPATNNALALIESQSDLTLVAGLIRRDPVLVQLYSSVTNATLVTAVDSSFPTTNTSALLYANREFLRAVLQGVVIEGQYPTTDITTDPIYANTMLRDPRYINTTRDHAVAKLVELDGKKTVDIGTGTRANITTGVRSPEDMHRITNVPSGLGIR